MSAKAKALELIRAFEGCRLTAYPDPATGADPWTCGWGSTGPDIHRGTHWTQDQADNRLLVDVARLERAILALVHVPLTDGQLGALICFAYNCGLANLAKSTLLKLLNAGDYAAASEQFARWNKAAGQVMRGLTRRRAAEKAVFDAG